MKKIKSITTILEQYPKSYFDGSGTLVILDKYQRNLILPEWLGLLGSEVSLDELSKSNIPDYCIEVPEYRVYHAFSDVKGNTIFRINNESLDDIDLSLFYRDVKKDIRVV